MIKIKNRYLIYFIIAGVLLGSFLGSLRANALTFGSLGSTGSEITIENTCVAGYYQMGATNGTADSISAYLTSNWLYEGGGKCKIYYGSNGTALVNGVTNEVFIGDSVTGFTTFDFPNPKPKLNANVYYYLVIFGSSDGGTCTFRYLTTGTSTTTYKSAVYSSFPASWTGTTSIDSSSTPRIYCTYSPIIPTVPTSFTAKPNGINSYNINLAWIKGTDAIYTRIMYKTSGYPTNHLDGILAYNNTGSSYILTGLTKSTLYYFSAWSYTDGVFSTTYATSLNVTLPSFSIYEVQAGTTTIKQLSNNTIKVYANASSSNVWLTENIGNAIGTHIKRTLSNGTIRVYANYTSDLDIVAGYHQYLSIDYFNYTFNHSTGTWEINSTSVGYPVILHSNIINATGTLTYEANASIKAYNVYATYTGNTSICPSCNSTNLVLYENIVNATGVHQSLYNPVTGWKVWANYTGNVSLGNCSGVYWFNYTDDNVTINISFNKQTNSFIDDYEINEENWLSLASALLFDNSQFFIIILLSLWLFFVSKYLEHKDLTVALMQFGLSIPLCIIVAVISLSFAFGYIIVFLIPIISLILLADGFFYSKKKR